MAQLRDKQTSEILFEGSPEEVALLADRLGRAEVMFDDVGERFQPDAVLEARAQELAAAEAQLAEPDIPQQEREAVTARLDRLQEQQEHAVAAEPPAQARIEEARARVED